MPGMHTSHSMFCGKVPKDHSDEGRGELGPFVVLRLTTSPSATLPAVQHRRSVQKKCASFVCSVSAIANKISRIHET